ncbi:MAG: 2OG-Fe(II) oxygenase [Marivibrio sp.]|uniref:2OG-Fe(II) oxygenase n=1 Tax=Marivibrio sp. TaxID=2039719 RepID=UPI0032EEC898
MLADTLLAKADPAAIRRDPFPHLVIDEALPTDRARALLDSAPDPTAGCGRPASRIPIEARLMTTLPFYPEIWRAFTERHTRPDVTRAVRRLFADHWPAHSADVDLETPRYALLNGANADAAEIITDARLETISPNPDAPASHRGPHLDDPARLFSCLWYLRAPEDEGAGGGLTLYRFRGERPARAEDAFALPDAAVEAVETLAYRFNRLVLFPNRPDALHGAAERAPNPLPRRYVFVTAETRRPLY